ncbi:F-box protein At4g22280-like [Hibiscus syriacus]|uniref:F-box protein At4g22280-like n=1 Tax=Hibiscus syriacus TaxID=106335 RepID=UPI001923BBAD|nr:F-box protein At4g22280-like [Hibiscus syriacus]
MVLLISFIIPEIISKPCTANRAKYEGLDSLPDSILCHILSFLPSRDAARTSVLSPKWRYFFTSSLTTLDFDDCLDGMCLTKNSMKNFKVFVDKFFFNPNHLRLECFRVNDLWLYAALWRGVKEVEVDLANGACLILLHLLFTCTSLLKLELYIHSWKMKVPNKLNLPKLRTLYLSDMSFEEGLSIRRLISTCPVLEDFDLCHCYIYGTSDLNIRGRSLTSLVLDSVMHSSHEGHRHFDYVIQVDAPNLVRFKYSDCVGKGYAFRNTESLEKACITITHFDDVNRNEFVTLCGICNVHTLLLTIHDNSVLLSPKPDKSVLAFRNLVELEFRNPGSDWKGTWIVEFLRFVPNMKKLILDLVDGYRGMKSLPQEAPPCLLYQIKQISILSFEEHKQMYEVVSYFLKLALVLEKLEFGGARQQSIIEKLLSLPKSSKECEVVILCSSGTH